MRKRTAGLISIAALLASIGAAAPPESPGPVVINEIAWGGAEWGATAEWIELFNASQEPVDLAGWRLVSSDGSPDIDLRGTIEPSVEGDPTTGFFLLERSNDDSVPGIAADQIYLGALTDRGETLHLYNPSGHLADTANGPAETMEAWPAGTDAHGVPPHASMERLDYRMHDAPEAWANSTAEPDSEEGARPMRGTPKAENSVFNIPPTPSFDLAPRHPLPGMSVEFDASGSSDENDRIASYRWDFGDGTEGSGPIASHAYAVAGEYRVTLTLTDEKGARSELERIVRVGATSPPIADFSVVPLPPNRVPRAGSPVRFQDESSDVDGEIASWEWQLGDGTTASEAQVLHTYERFGVYRVTLRVLDDQGERATHARSLTIASRAPIAVLTRTPDRPNIGESVHFDASESHDPDGDIAAYRWDLDGDGVDELETVEPFIEHAFAASGDHDVRLTVVDDNGDTSGRLVDTVHVNHPPIAEYRLSTFEAAELDPIRFTDMSYDEDGGIVEWLWDFGDGTASTEISPEHAFEDDGTFTVSLTVTDGGGSQDTTAAEVRITNLPPIAQLSIEESTRPTGEAFRFDSSASADPSLSGSITRYEWDFDGDGTFDETTTAPILSHAFDDDGSYEVTVRVTDDDEAAAISDPVSVTVTNRPPRVDRIEWTPEAPTDAEEVHFAAEASDPDGQIVAWFWDFGDETVITESDPTTSFSDDGRYTIVLTVEDDDGARSDPFSVEVIVENAPPVAQFVVAAADESCVVFDARGSTDPSPTGEIVHVAWDFGDGTSCPGTPEGCGDGDRWAPGHCYPGPGQFVVTLVVIDEQGALARSERIVLILE